MFERTLKPADPEAGLRLVAAMAMVTTAAVLAGLAWLAVLLTVLLKKLLLMLLVALFGAQPAYIVDLLSPPEELVVHQVDLVEPEAPWHADEGSVEVLEPEDLLGSAPPPPQPEAPTDWVARGDVPVELAALESTILMRIGPLGTLDGGSSDHAMIGLLGGPDPLDAGVLASALAGDMLVGEGGSLGVGSEAFGTAGVGGGAAAGLGRIGTGSGVMIGTGDGIGFGGDPAPRLSARSDALPADADPVTCSGRTTVRGVRWTDCPTALRTAAERSVERHRAAHPDFSGVFRVVVRPQR